MSGPGKKSSALSRSKTVWWNADTHAAAVYQVPLDTNANLTLTGHALLILNRSENFFTNAAPPDLVICSRGDIYDNNGAVANFVHEKHFAKTADLQGFTIWENK